MNPEERHIFSVLVENRFGVLARVAGLFSGRGFNIDSLNVAETHDKSISQITLVTHGDAQIIEQIYHHLNRLIDVIEVTDLSTAGTMLSASLCLSRLLPMILKNAPRFYKLRKSSVGGL
ncbi:Probable acetolactate synthase small subunit [Geodia barretti]|uniref:Acetolactate synthase small subunit n=1 Tax=Geodia barretti TaxID=519541 RepID=A0AA35TUU3_GEOBA|nr:Probable acetolactate synthase small subunit [Geodia barretti]